MEHSESSSREPLTVVGGGIAGLSAALSLARIGVPCRVYEALAYPRKRVCGEFVSGDGLRILKELGLLGRLAGCARRIETLAVFSDRRRLAVTKLPKPALAVPRFVLDHAMAQEAEARGVELIHERWSGPLTASGWVRATGRRIRSAAPGARWFGLKAHARGLSLDADLELHFLPNGYLGLCQLPNGIVNACALYRTRQTMPNLREEWPRWLSGPESSPLRRRMALGELDPNSACFVAGLHPGEKDSGETDECRVGDSWTWTPPFTGNGMSMALESGELAAASLGRFHRGEVSWARARKRIAADHARRFSSRLWWANKFHRPLLNSAMRRIPSFGTPVVGPLCRWIFSITR